MTKAGETVKINKTNKVEGEIMACLSKKFSLTNDNSTMENDFTSQVGYLTEKYGAEDILNGQYHKHYNVTQKPKSFWK